MKKGYLILTTALCMLLFSLSCSGRVNDSEQTPTQKTDAAKEQTSDHGVRKDEKGHLSVSGIPHVRVKRLVAYFNSEAKSLRKNSQGPYPYKVSGRYITREVLGEIIDEVKYEIQFNFESPDRASSSKDDSKIRETLQRLNKEAIESGQDYKLKGNYSLRKTGKGETLSERIDLFLQFSFDSLLGSLSLEIERDFIRASIPLLPDQKKALARTALEFVRLLEKPEVLTITVFNFVGDSPQGYQWTYVFSREEVLFLQKIQRDTNPLPDDEILTLAEVKQRITRLPPAQRGVARKEEPAAPHQKEIIARIALETARVIRPMIISITIYSFEEKDLSTLTTLAYVWSNDAVTVLAQDELGAEEILKLAGIVEERGVLPGGRTLPPDKPLRETSDEQHSPVAGE